MIKTNFISKIIGVVIMFSTIHTSQIQAEVITRAALDVGSGGLKVTIADVDTDSKQIVKKYYSDELTVAFKRDMQVSGKNEFSEEIQKIALEVMGKLKEELSFYKPVEWIGIATAASRQSKNAEAFYDKVNKELGIKIKVISQEEEGRLGFLTAEAVSGIAKQHIISYDSGSGSFQLTSEIEGVLEIVGGQLGMIPALTELVKGIRGKELDQVSSPNPISLFEASTLVERLKGLMPSVSEKFMKKINNEDSVVVGIGNKNFIFAHAANIIGKPTYTKEELWSVIEAHCGLSDKELQKFSVPHEAVIGMLLLYSVMDGIGINSLTYANANGSCEGLLVDPTHWTKI